VSGKVATKEIKVAYEIECELTVEDDNKYHGIVLTNQLGGRFELGRELLKEYRSLIKTNDAEWCPIDKIYMYDKDKDEFKLKNSHMISDFSREMVPMDEWKYWVIASNSEDKTPPEVIKAADAVKEKLVSTEVIVCGQENIQVVEGDVTIKALKSGSNQYKVLFSEDLFGYEG
jgi:hypothetical protein